MDKEEIKSDRKLKIIGRILLSWLFLYVCWALSFCIAPTSHIGAPNPIMALQDAVYYIFRNVEISCLFKSFDLFECGLSNNWNAIRWFSWLVISIPVSYFHLLIASVLSFVFRKKSFLFQSKVLQALLIALLMIAMVFVTSSMQQSSGHPTFIQ